MARTAARRVPGPHSTWFLTAAAKISRASSSGGCLAGAAPSTGARAVMRTGMSWVCGRLSGIFFRYVHLSGMCPVFPLLC